jgi:hypothetical protein
MLPLTSATQSSDEHVFTSLFTIATQSSELHPFALFWMTATQSSEPHPFALFWMTATQSSEPHLFASFWMTATQSSVEQRKTGLLVLDFELDSAGWRLHPLAETTTGMITPKATTNFQSKTKRNRIGNTPKLQLDSIIIFF